jgi:hypothetical protein
VDVLLLADVFENYRQMMYSNFKLDPAHYISSPHFAWDAMLKFTKASIGLISDPDMYEMVSAGIRGGLCQIVTRYVSYSHMFCF